MPAIFPDGYFPSDPPFRKVFNALMDELTARGVETNKADVYTFVAWCWPTEATAEQLADEFVRRGGKVTR